MVRPFNQPFVCPVLVGREVTLATLRTAIDQAKRGTGQVILIAGEAGIGKTRLISEAVPYALSQDFAVMQGNCFPPDVDCPYAPFLDLLRTYFNDSSPDKDRDREFLRRESFTLIPEIVPPDLPESLFPEQEKRRLFSVLAQFFLHQAARRPILVIVEDLHWCDDTSLEFLHHLVRRCSGQPFLLLLTYRSDEVSSSLHNWLAHMDRERTVHELRLNRLAYNNVRTMLTAISPASRSIRSDFLDSVFTLTEGNPFFIEEVVRSVLQTGDLVHNQEETHQILASGLHIPRTVQAAVQQRVLRLSRAASRLVVLAAVTGRRFDFDLLRELTHLDEQALLNAIKELIEAQLVVEETADKFAFRHALTREAIYAGLLAREQKALHQLIAETIERLYAASLDAYLGDLAYHFFQVGAWDKALDYSLLAGERAWRLYALSAAIDHLSRAAEAAAHLDARPSPQLHRMRGLSYEALGEFEQARLDQERALQLAQAERDRRAEWQALIDLGMLWASQNYGKAGAYYRQAFNLARDIGDEAIFAHSLNRLGNWHLNAEEPHEARAHHLEALAIFQSLKDTTGVAETLDLLGMADYLSGDLIEGTAYYREAVVLFRELDDRAGLCSSLTTLTLRGPTYQTATLISEASDLGEAAYEGEQALKIARDNHQRSSEAFALIMLAMCRGAQGEYAQAFDMAREGLSLAEEIGHWQWMLAGNVALGLLYRDVLELSLAQQHLETAVSLAHRIGSLYWVCGSTGHLASVYILRGDTARAKTLLGKVLDLQRPIRTLAQRLLWQARIELALVDGDGNEALRLTDMLIEATPNKETGKTKPAGLLKLRGEALAVLGQLDEARESLQRALDIARAQDAQPIVWRTHIVLGRLYQQQRQDAVAQRHLTEARTVVERLAAGISDVVVRDRFVAATRIFPHALERSTRRTDKARVGGLTEREREIAVLVAQGKTNREIAAALVIAERTVETHIGNILSKLDFTSRTQIATWAVEKGLLTGNT